MEDRGERPDGGAFDLLIAATAIAADLPLYTANATDLGGLEDLLEIVPV